MDIWRSLRLIRGQSVLFFLACVVAFVLVMIAPLFTAKKLMVYKSSTKVLITPTTSAVTLAGERQTDNSVKTWFADPATLKTLLSSQDLLTLVLEAAHSSMTWTDLRERIQLDILSNTGNQVSLLEVSVMGTKPEETRVLALTLSEKFIQYVQQLSASEQDRTVAFLERERRNAEREVARAQKRLLSVGIVPTDGKSNPLDDAWVQLQQQRNQLERDVALVRAEVDQLEQVGDMDSSLSDLADAGTTNSVMSDAVAREQLKLAELRETYTEQAPQVQTQITKIQRMQQVYTRELNNRVSGRRAGLLRKAEKMESLLAETERRLRALEAKRPSAEKHLEFANQNRQLAMWQENYLDLTRQLYRARVMQQGSRREGAFTIVEKPQPGKLVSGKVAEGSPVMRLLIAIPVALVCGLGAVMAHDYLTSSMRLQPRIEEAMGVPIIGQIPSQGSDLISQWDNMKGKINRSKAVSTESLEIERPKVLN